MAKSVAIIGAGVSGLTCGIVFAERGFSAKIFAEQIGTQTTSGAAGALWFPYDAEPADKVIPWALATYKILAELADHQDASRGDKLDGLKPSSSQTDAEPENIECKMLSGLETGVSMIELRQYCRAGKIEIPEWAIDLGAKRANDPSVTAALCATPSRPQPDCYSVRVPLADTTIYLDYLINRFQKAGGEIKSEVHFDKLEDVNPKFDLTINCAGIGARELARDPDLEPHRGQVAIVARPENVNCAIVCDDAPLMYVIPRTNDCVFGGTNDVSDDWNPDPNTTKAIVAECSRVLEIETPRVLRERVGLRPFRKSGVRLEKETLSDDRTVIHNYGHGGSGFTLSWGCAEEVLKISG